MTDQSLNEFDDLTPCPAPPRLRAGVLAAVDRQLSESGFMLPSATAGLPSSVVPADPCTKSTSPRLSLEKLSAWTVAAALLVGIGLCSWQQRVDARLVALYGPASVRAEIANLVRSVESVGGPGSGRWIAERLLASKSERDRRRSPQEPFTTFQISSLP